MKIYKLKYTNREQANADLIAKDVIDNKNTLGIVYIGKVADVITEDEVTYLDGYHIDIACKEDLHNFGDKEIFPNNPKHVFG